MFHFHLKHREIESMLLNFPLDYILKLFTPREYFTLLNMLAVILKVENKVEIRIENFISSPRF